MPDETRRDSETYAISPNQVTLVTTQRFLESRGPEVQLPYQWRPLNAKAELSRPGTIDQLRDRLRHLEKVQELHNPGQPPLDQPIPVKVRGTLFPCGLLSAGWWQRVTHGSLPKLDWRSPIQRWHFVGFNEWAPSWDFSWYLDDWDQSQHRQHFLAQFGDGDEGDSLPIYMGQRDAITVHENLQDWGGMTAEVTGLLGHRTHFPKFGPDYIQDVGGWMNYCLWLDPNKSGGSIEPAVGSPDIYSGYLWKCITPTGWFNKGKVGLDDVFFIWVHTDFSKPSAVAFSKDLLSSQEKLMHRHIENTLGEKSFTLLAKSSSILDGEVAWKHESDMRNLLELKKPSTDPQRGDKI